MKVHAGCELTMESEADCALLTMLAPRLGQGRWAVDNRPGWRRSHGFGEFDDAFGNRCQRFVIPAGRTAVRFEVEATALPRLDTAPGARRVEPMHLPAEALQFLLPSRYCPSDRSEVFERALSIVGDAAPGYAQVERICDWIAEHIAYRPGISNSHTDALDTLRDGGGVCRDFAHVGAALCRSIDIPARVVVGWLHDLKPMDMHAWFEVYVGDRWYAFDPTQATRNGGRVVIGHGRDAADVAFLTSFRPLQSFSIQVWTNLRDAA